ncbi:MAG: alkaline phosphatase family protein [Deltaproteobacteria bacterium]|nr:alkaline phosphatase family protein [Deltaproteobacteria bacterium]
MARLLVIGLDCATPQYVFDEWPRDLPVLDRLMEEGTYGVLTSTIPPITVPAWICMLSSKDPGQLGIYGFRNRKSYRYGNLYIPNSTHIRERMVWEYLDDAGLTSILIGIPQTFPPKPLRGIMVASFLAPDKSVQYTYPAEVKAELDRIADGDYMFDVRNFRRQDKGALLDEIYLMTRRRFKVVRHYLEHNPWDFFMFVEMGIDRIHHGFWRFQDKEHRLYDPGSPYRNVIKRYYQEIDRQIGDLLAGVESDVAVMVVSDHGAKRMDGAVCINEWLIRQGYLRLKVEPDSPTRLTEDMIDWQRTLAWGEGGYYSRIFLNVKGREPQGILPQEDLDRFRDQLKGEMESLEGNESGPDRVRVLRPEEIYRSVENIPPDLLVCFGDLSWRGAGTVGHKKIYLYENDTGPDDANHAQEGIFVFRGDSASRKATPLAARKRLDGLSLYDVAPTILDFFGIPVPSDMVGRSILGEASRISSGKVPGPQPQGKDYSPDEEEIIRRHLEDLGYL